MQTVDSVESGEVRAIVTGTQPGCGLTVGIHVVYVLTHPQVGLFVSTFIVITIISLQVYIIVIFLCLARSWKASSHM